MSAHLVPCPGCARHVRADEGTCPFCEEVIPSVEAPLPPPKRRLGRAALFAFSAATAGVVAMTGCGDDVTPAPPYGAPPMDSSVVDGAPDDAETDAAADAADDASADAAPDAAGGALYGGPPVDGG